MRYAAAVVLTLVLVSPAPADTVHLTNGRSFKEVVTERLGDSVRISLPHGEIVLPNRIVARIENSRSAWQQYADLEARLLGRPDATPAEWLALARWALDADYREGVRKAAVRAATLDPRLPGLAPLLAEFGYRFDESSGGWLEEDEYMRRRGFVRSGSGWITRAEAEEFSRVAREDEIRRREDARQERMTRAIEVLAAAQLLEDAAPARPAGGGQGVPVVAVYSGGFFSLPVSSGSRRLGNTVAAHQHASPVAAHHHGSTYDDLIGRQPGSLLPVGGAARRLPQPPPSSAPPARHYVSRDSP